jgi:RHS repeat-associated protein
MLLRFGDLTGVTSAVPADAVVSDAALTLTERAESGSVTPLDTGIYRAGTFSTAVTWATQPGIGAVQERLSVAPNGVNSTVTFHIPNLVNSWIKGTNANNGVMIKQIDDTVPANSLSFYGMANAAHPTLTVTWRPIVGQQKWVGAYDHTLTDRMDLHVDLADRNLVLNNTEENLSAPGQSLVVRRTYNSRTAAATTGPFGVGWTMSGGTDVTSATNHAAVTLTLPGGAQAVFYRAFGNDDLTQPNAFIRAPGLNADLTMPDSTHYKLTFRKTKVVDTFTLAAAGAATGWLSSVKDADGNTTTFTAAGSPLVTTKVTDTTGQRSVGFSYTSGRVTGMSETLASGARTWGYGYDATGHLSSYTDPAGKVTTYCWTGALLTKIITPHGVAGGATCAVSTNKDTTDISYDTSGGVSSIKYENSVGTPTVLTFTARSTLPLNNPNATAVTRFTDPFGKNTDYTYDTADRVTKTVDPLNNTTATTYTTNNDVSTAVSANNNTGGASDPVTTNSYDANNNATKVQLPTGAAVSATYAGAQAFLPDTTTDDLGNGSSNTYNAAGHLTSTTKGGAKVTKVYEGDGGVHCGPAGAAAFGGSLCEARDADYNAATPAEHRTHYTYDALGQLVIVTPPTPDHGRATSPVTTLTYDPQSRPHTVTDGLGRTTTYKFDLLDRLTRLDYSGGTATTFGYDEDGDQTSQVELAVGGTVRTQDVSTYDAMDRRVSFNNAGTGQQTVTWDANSRMTGYADAGGTVTYGYDSAGRLTSIAEPGGTCAGAFSPDNPPPAANLCTLFQLDRNGSRLRTVFPGGLSEVDNSYDTAGRPKEINDKAQVAGALASVADFTYAYKSGAKDTTHVITRTDKTDASSTLTYGYGTQGRLASAIKRSSGGTVQASAFWCYDANGNRTNTSTTAGFTCPGTATSSYDGANQQLTSNFGGTGYSYDADGQELTAPTGASGSTQTRTSTYTTHQQVDTIKATAAGDTLHRTYLGAGNDERIASDVSATVTDKQANGPLGISSYTRVTSGVAGTPTYVTRDPQGGLIGLRTGGSHIYLETDNLGSVLKVVTSAGAVANSYTYDPYGVTTGSSGTVLEPFRYTGAYTDQTTGLTKLGARYYDPTLGRFTQTDPQTHPDDVNQSSPYPYAGNDPINIVDPSGRGFWADAIFVVGVVALSAAVGGLPEVGFAIALTIDLTVGLVGAYCSNNPQSYSCTDD